MTRQLCDRAFATCTSHRRDHGLRNGMTSATMEAKRAAAAKLALAQAATKKLRQAYAEVAETEPGFFVENHDCFFRGMQVNNDLLHRGLGTVVEVRKVREGELW